MNHREALLLLLDCVDYESGACRMNEPIGGVLPVEVLRRAKLAAQHSVQADGANKSGKCWMCEQGITHLREHCEESPRR